MSLRVETSSMIELEVTPNLCIFMLCPPHLMLLPQLFKNDNTHI